MPAAGRAALTMRMWSEERRSGTLEFLLTQPVSPLRFVIGKFLACLALVAIALALTLPLPVTVALLGDIDGGPVFGAYFATLFLAAAYIAIGLTVSAKSDSQIVSLIVTVLACAAFYLIGSDTLISLVGYRAGELFKSLGTGSRFSAITRGVFDLRDLYYYLSIIGVFIALNVYFLESGRWAKETGSPAHKRWRALTALLAANFIAGNVWLSQIGWARADVTEGRLYSISGATRGYLAQIYEPLLIRGYFSAKTHPLLAPLVPRLRDLILEYEVAGKGKVRAEFIDPLENPELEEEAAKYNIKPVPFQVADRYQASLVNSYFDILVQYGDQYEVLNFRDLIEIKSQSESDLDVELRNPEYEITRAIKKVLYQYQSGGDLFANLDKTVTFTGYLSPDEKLPAVLADFRKEMTAVLDDLKKASAGRFEHRAVDPESEGGALAREIAEKYGLQPMRAGLFDANAFYFYLTLSDGEQVIQVPLPENMSKERLKSSIEAAMKRFSTGFVKSVALYTPPERTQDPAMAQLRMPSGRSFDLLQEVLGRNHRVRMVELESSHVPEEADILLAVAPDNLDEKQLYAMDQFLMKGGTVVLSAAPFQAQITEGTLTASKHETGLKAWLEHHGIAVEEAMVLDPRNAMLPIPIRRNLGGLSVQEIRMVEYPYFVDISRQGSRRRRRHDLGPAPGHPQLGLARHHRPGQERGAQSHAAAEKLGQGVDFGLHRRAAGFRRPRPAWVPIRRRSPLPYPGSGRGRALRLLFQEQGIASAQGGEQRSGGKERGRAKRRRRRRSPAPSKNRPNRRASSCSRPTSSSPTRPSVWRPAPGAPST